MLITKNVWSHITKAATACIKPSHVAVAYYSESGGDLLPLKKGSTLVVDASLMTVSSGGTSPKALLAAYDSGIEVFNAPNLHAKVFAFDKVGFVGSANASANSEKLLIEAIYRVDDQAELKRVRKFIESLKLYPLTRKEIVSLGDVYSPQKKIGKYPSPKQPTIMVMEITSEQGGARNSQVQVPLPAWASFFGFQKSELEKAPVLQLENEDSPGSHVYRKIVDHDHNYTVELPGAKKGMIAVFKRKGPRQFSYRLVQQHDADYHSLSMFLATQYNPLRTKGRLWAFR